MRGFFLTLCCILFLAETGFAQSFCDDSGTGYIRIENCSVAPKLEVDLFNNMAKHYGIRDTISYVCQDNNLSYAYQGKPIDDWKYDPRLCGEKLMLRGSRNSRGFKLLASIPIGKNRSQVYEVIKSEKEKDRIIFKAYQEQGILPVGDYVEKNCAGQVLIEGRYDLISSPSKYSYYRYDREKRESMLENIENDQTSVRTGVWKFYNEKGVLLYEENYNNNELRGKVPAVELCADFKKISPWNYYKAEKIPAAISLYNFIDSLLDNKMYLSYDISHRGLTYYLNGKKIADPFFDMQGKYKPWDHQMKNHEGVLLLESFRGSQLRVYIPAEDGRGEFISFQTNRFNRSKSLNKFETLNYLPDGTFERRNCDGIIILKGNYTTIDTTYSIREEIIDINTYEKKTVERTINHKTIRTGEWRYFSNDGTLLLEEDYAKTPSWTLKADLLCSSTKEEARRITENISNPFIIFNSVCKQFGLNYWFSQDNILDQEEYYFNGELIDAPTLSDRANYTDNIVVRIPEGEVKITAKSNNYAALGRKEQKLKINFKALINYDDNRGEELYFSSNKLKRIQTTNQIRDGLYEEKQCNGQWLVRGQYCQIDSLYRDTISVISPETYETKITVVEHDKFGKSSGVWLFFNEEGKLEKEIDYGKCN